MSLRERTVEVRKVEFRASGPADGQTLKGYAAVFNEWTAIQDRQGSYKERIAPGAFKRTIGQRTPVLQFDHGTHPLIGSMPLGRFTAIREDRNGLYVEADLSDNWMINVVRDAIRDGGVNGMSFRFRVIDDEWGTDSDGETRTIKEVELLEAGPVVFPAYEQTTVAVRSLVGALDDEMRDALRRELSPETDPVEGRTDEDIAAEGTSDVASEPAVADSPDEPPVESSHDPRTRMAAALARIGRQLNKETPDVSQ